MRLRLQAIREEMDRLRKIKKEGSEIATVAEISISNERCAVKLESVPTNGRYRNLDDFDEEIRRKVVRDDGISDPLLREPKNVPSHREFFMRDSLNIPTGKGFLIVAQNSTVEHLGYAYQSAPVLGHYFEEKGCSRQRFAQIDGGHLQAASKALVTLLRHRSVSGRIAIDSGGWMGGSVDDRTRPIQRRPRPRAIRS